MPALLLGILKSQRYMYYIKQQLSTFENLGLDAMPAPLLLRVLMHQRLAGLCVFRGLECVLSYEP